MVVADGFVHGIGMLRAVRKTLNFWEKKERNVCADNNMDPPFVVAADSIRGRNGCVCLNVQIYSFTLLTMFVLMPVSSPP